MDTDYYLTIYKKGYRPIYKSIKYD